MISFKGKHFPKDVILFAVYFYLRYPVSYQDLQEIMEERGVDVDDATMNRWVIEYGPQLAEEAQKRKVSGGRLWRMDETYVKVKGRWMYQYRVVDKHGKTVPNDRSCREKPTEWRLACCKSWCPGRG